MIIEYVGKKADAFSDYALNRTTLTVAGIAVDLASEQRDQEVTIPFSRQEGMVRRGITPCGEYAAEIVIPPRRYETVERAETTETENGAEEQTYTETVSLPLDINTVTLKLWSVNREAGHDN
jgi:hypothetical protein